MVRARRTAPTLQPVCLCVSCVRCKTLTLTRVCVCCVTCDAWMLLNLSIYTQSVWCGSRSDHIITGRVHAVWDILRRGAPVSRGVCVCVCGWHTRAASCRVSACARVTWIRSRHAMCVWECVSMECVWRWLFNRLSKSVVIPYGLRCVAHDGPLSLHFTRICCDSVWLYVLLGHRDGGARTTLPVPNIDAHTNNFGRCGKLIARIT